MSRSENPPNPSEVRGRGTGETPFSYLAEFNTEEGEEGFVFEKGKGRFGASPVPRPLFDPASELPYASDVKGKDTAMFDRMLVGPNERPWHVLDKEQVRYRATTVPAVLLSKAERMAAGRDPGLEWCAQTRTYRPRRKPTSAPQAAGGGQ